MLRVLGTLKGAVSVADVIAMLHVDVGPGVSGDYVGNRAVQELVVDTLGDFEFNKTRTREDITIGPFILWFLNDITVRDGQRHECSEVIVFRVVALASSGRCW